MQGKKTVCEDDSGQKMIQSVNDTISLCLPKTIYLLVTTGSAVQLTGGRTRFLVLPETSQMTMDI